MEATKLTFKHASGDVINIQTFDSNGVKVGEYNTLPAPNDATLVEAICDPTGNTTFQYIVVSGTAVSGSGQDGFNLKAVSVIDSSGGNPESWDYKVDVHAVLSDTDGSETLSAVTVTLPDGDHTVTLDGNGDGTITYNSSTQITDTSVFSASVTATETSNSDEATVEATENTYVFGDDSEGFMLDFDNVDQADLPKVDEIDLSASGEHILSNLSLEDFLAMTDDNTLKISGDDIITDSITGLTDNGWILADTSDPSTISETGYTTWTNAADTSVQLLIDDDIDVVS